MSDLGVLVLIWVLAAAAQALGWRWQAVRATAGIVDVIWSACLGLSAVLIAMLGGGGSWPRVLLGLLGGLWATRLAAHLWLRVRNEREDGRYLQLRQRWSGYRHAQLRWFVLFQVQAALVVLFSLPFLAVAANPEPRFTGWSALAIAIWLVAVAGEAVADGQLARFRADPANRGRTCRSGLWRYSRHPNYFFEWLHWFTYVALAAGSPTWWLAWMGPLVMYVFLRYFSGIPFTEAQALRTRGEDYRDYQRVTPMLFPWKPRTREKNAQTY